MNKNEENKLVPKLRFPEFQNQGNWEELTLGEIGEPLMCKRIFREETTPNPNNGVPFYKIGTFGRLADSYISKEIYEKYKSKFSFPKIGDILISASGTIGRLVIYDGSPAYFQDSNIIWLGHNEDKVLNSFLFYSYSNLKWQTSDGGIISRLYNSDFKRMEICFPQNEREQQKIASCLSSLDEIFTAEGQKLAVLKEHKKGLLQNLFPVDNETAPKFRFEEFQDSDEWQEDILLNIARFRRGSFPQPYGLPEWYDDEKGIPFIQVFDVDDNFRLKPTTKNKISELAAKQSVFIPKGTLIITLQGSIGRVAITQYDAYIDRTLLLFEEFYKELDLTFFAYTIFLLFEIEKQKAPGGIIKTITKEVLSSFVVKIPSIQEQKKIASCLSSLDELIYAQSQKVEALKLQKKGLLQNLFPNIN